MGTSHSANPEDGKEEKPRRRTPKSVKETNEIGLTSVEIRMIRKSWKFARRMGKEEPGLSILLEMFSKNAKVMDMFAKNRLQHAAELNDPKMKEDVMSYEEETNNFMDGTAKGNKFSRLAQIGEGTHAQQMNVTMGMVIDNLETPNDVIPGLRILGHRHARMKTPGFTSHHWDVFGEALVEKSLGWCENGRINRNTVTLDAWCKIGLFMITHMKTGFEVERKSWRKQAVSDRKSVRSLEEVPASPTSRQCDSEKTVRRRPPLLKANTFSIEP